MYDNVWLLYIFHVFTKRKIRRRGKKDGRKRRDACFGSVVAAARCDHMLLQVDSVSRQLYQSGGGISS